MFSEVAEIARVARKNALNQEKFALATDDTVGELRNGAKKYQH